ncbi:MAG: hypothetical protein P8Y69_02655 [Gammaproteobacteria bacterium]|jgi:hypothetical protein
MIKQTLLATALGALISSGIALAAPGGQGASQGAQGRPEQSKSMTRAESEAREMKREHAPEAGERDRNQVEQAERAREEAQTKGNETSAEMQARREERKEIQEEYRTAGGEQAKKKPWWKFWGNDS